jgi:hypothetical protein
MAISTHTTRARPICRSCASPPGWRAGQAGRHGQGRSARAHQPGDHDHTGCDADDPAGVSALLRAHGAIEVADIVELAETLAAFQTVQRAAGRRLAVITSSGGLAELILDVATEIGIELSPAQKAAIEAEIGSSPATATRSTPGAGDVRANLPLALKLFDASPAYDVIAFVRDNFGHEERSTLYSSSGRYRFGNATSAERRRTGRDAPFPVIPVKATYLPA